MTKNKKHIVFITPTLNRTGSELVIYNLIKHLPEDVDVTVVSKYKGQLYNELPSRIQKDYLFEKQDQLSLVEKIRRKYFYNSYLTNKLGKYKNAVWYINTIVLPDIMEFAIKNNIAVVLHVHELQHMYALLNQQQIKALTSYPKLIIANSKASKQVLEGYKATSPIEIVNPTADYAGFNFNEELYRTYRNKLNITNEFVWVMSGSYDENKNPKLFIETAAQLKKVNTNFKFLWIGSSAAGNTASADYKIYAKQLGVEDTIIWIENTNTYYEYFNCADGLLLTSKLESFSLVTLEALHLGLPIVANNCVGVNEILNGEYGVVINNANAQQLSEEMIKVMGNSSSRAIAKGKFIAGRFDMDLIKNKWLTNLKQFIS